MTTEHQQKLTELNILPVFNEQTPKTEPFDISKADKEFFQLVEDIGFFANHNQYLELAGLAANQIQKSGKRIDLRLCYIMIDGKLTPALNPIITEKFGTVYRSKEGCLTWPDKKVVANRYEGVEVKYLNFPDLKETTRKIATIEALIWQHEIDHLDGKPEEFITQLTSGTTQKPNDPCNCKSGKKFKKCCGR